MADCNLAILDDVFKRLGVYVHWWYDLATMKDTLDERLEEAVTKFKIINAGAGSDEPSDVDIKAYEALAAEISRQKSAQESLRYSVVNLVANFLGLNVKDLLDVPYSSASDILDKLWDLMVENADTVLDNTVDVNPTVAEDEDNSVIVADGLTLPTLDDPPPQMAQDDSFSLVCTDDSIVGQERWVLNSAVHGRYANELTTAEAMDWESAGIEDLTISEAPLHGFGFKELNDTDDEFDNWDLKGVEKGVNTDANGNLYGELTESGGTYTVTLYKSTGPLANKVAEGTTTSATTTVTLSEQNSSGMSGTVDIDYDSGNNTLMLVMKVSDVQMTGAVRATNISEDGRFWLKFNDTPASIVEDGDDDSQISFDSITGCTFGTHTDAEGKMHISVVKKPSTYTVDTTEDTVAVLVASSIEIYGADTSSGGNAPYGELYLKVLMTNSGADYQIKCYRDSARTQQVGESSTYASYDFTEAIEFSEYGSSGLSGRVVLSSYGYSPDATTDTDSTMRINIPRYFVRAYSSSSRLEDDFVDEVVSPTPTASNLTFGSIVAQVDLAYVQDSSSINVIPKFGLTDMYKADPDDSETTEADIVARAGDIDGYMGLGFSDHPFYAMNNSGLTDITMDASSDSMGYPALNPVVSACVGDADGDAFTVKTTSTDAALFQTFLRESFGKVLPTPEGSASETADDDWANDSAPWS